MVNQFDFKTQICTTREQSEKLLALGLRKETADCCLKSVPVGWNEEGEMIREVHPRAFPPVLLSEFPAWSMHRLWVIAKIRDITLDDESEMEKLYDEVISHIEWQIREGIFNKEYLVCENR